jgi:hypothetical protein
MKYKIKNTTILLIFFITITITITIIIYLITNNFYNKNYELYDNINDNYGFVITRHVKSEETNKIWIMCISQIRKYHPYQKIIIIDDNSDYNFINNDNVDLTNITIIDSEFKGSGELLPYYYYYKNKWFEKMIFIHDSVFINNKINVDNVKNVKFLWYFNAKEGTNEEENKNIENLLNSINNDYKKDLLELFNSDNWKGCWGVMSIIEYNYLEYLQNKYNILNLINVINTRYNRMALERIFGLICCLENPSINKDNISIFGYYSENQNNRNSDNYNYNEFLEDINNNNMNVDINKLFFGR